MSPRRRSGKKIDFVHWTHFFNSQIVFAAGIVGAALTTATHLPETLMRMRGNLAAWPDGVQEGGIISRFGVGFIMVPEGTGTTVTWSPITDGDAPWIWVDYFTISYEEMVANVVDIPVLSGYRSVIDSKAMRINKNMEIQAVYEHIALSGTFNANVTVEGRFLSGT